MYTPGHPCHGPGFGPKNCWRSPKNCWRRINILLRDDTYCMFSIFPLCSRVSFELPLCSRVSFELWVCRRLIFVTTIFKTRPGVQLNPGSATAISEVLESSLIFSHHPGPLDEHPTTYAMLWCSWCWCKGLGWCGKYIGFKHLENSLTL